MKTILTIINIISALPILFYPAILIAGLGSFAGYRYANASLFDLAKGLALPIFSIGYPLFIIILIFVSRKYDSPLLATIALVPLLALLYVFTLSGGTDEKNNYNTLNKDFICNANSFLNISGKGNPIGHIELLEKKNFFSYENNTLATIYKDKWINIYGIHSKDITNKTDQMLADCKNSDGKSPLELFTLIKDDQVKDILKD
jgi:hypothetical protein